MIPLVWVWIWDGRQHRVTHPLLFTNNVWVFNVPQTLLYVQGVVRRVYRQGFFEKTRESNRFQTFYKDNTQLKTLSVGPERIWTAAASRCAEWRLPSSLVISAFFKWMTSQSVEVIIHNTLLPTSLWRVSAPHDEARENGGGGRWIRKGHFIRWTYCA